MDQWRTLLRELHGALVAAGARREAGLVEQIIAGADAGVEEFLRSNELWGGAGSVADQGFIEGSRDMRRRGLRAMVRLGNLQMERGVTNARTGMWVSAFEKWLNDGVV